jgi:hypothetical protein
VRLPGILFGARGPKAAMLLAFRAATLTFGSRGPPCRRSSGHSVWHAGAKSGLVVGLPRGHFHWRGPETAMLLVFRASCLARGAKRCHAAGLPGGHLDSRKPGATMPFPFRASCPARGAKSCHGAGLPGGHFDDREPGAAMPPVFRASCLKVGILEIGLRILEIGPLRVLARRKQGTIKLAAATGQKRALSCADALSRCGALASGRSLVCSRGRGRRGFGGVKQTPSSSPKAG